MMEIKGESVFMHDGLKLKMSDIEVVEGVIEKLVHHPRDAYGVKLIGDDRWFNGFYIPTHLKIGAKVLMDYVEKPGESTMYYNVVSITDDVKVHTQSCPHCGKNIFFTVNQ